LLFGGHPVVNFCGDGDEVPVNQVRRQSDLLGDLVEFGVSHGWQRVVLAVNGAGLQRGVDLCKGHRGRVRTKRATEELPRIRAWHPQVDASQIGGGLHVNLRTGLAQIHLAPPEIHRRQQPNAELILDLLFEGGHQRIVEDPDLMLRTLQHITGCEDRPLGKECGEFLRGSDRHFEVARGDSLQFGTLREQVPFQCGSKVAKSATAGPKTLIIAMARWSVSEFTAESRSRILSWANAPVVLIASTAAAARRARRVTTKNILVPPTG
jgi:hypothetical protein